MVVQCGCAWSANGVYEGWYNVELPSFQNFSDIKLLSAQACLWVYRVWAKYCTTASLGQWLLWWNTINSQTHPLSVWEPQDALNGNVFARTSYPFAIYSVRPPFAGYVVINLLNLRGKTTHKSLDIVARYEWWHSISF